MQRLFYYLFLPALVFLASCDEIDGGDPVVDEGLPTIVDFSAAPAEVSAGGSATLSWNVSDATSITIDNGVGDVTSDADNQFTVDNVQQTDDLHLNRDDAQGSAQEQTRVTVTGDTPAPPPPRSRYRRTYGQLRRKWNTKWTLPERRSGQHHQPGRRAHRHDHTRRNVLRAGGL